MLDTFTEQCLLCPDDTALVHDQRSLTYAELLLRSKELAGVLVSCGVCAGAVVGICTQRGIDTIAMMLACFHCKVAFLPIDHAYPDSRIAYTLSDAEVDALVVDTSTLVDAQRIAGKLNVRLINLDDNLSSQRPLEPMGLPGVAEQTTIAYIMYTSGSTGQPKGVPISHRALNCYCQADAQAYQLRRGDRTLQFSTLSFDICIEEIFPPLVTGGTVILRPAQRSEAQNELSDIIQRFDISAVHLATGYWHEWVDMMKATDSQVPECLRLMVVTGEKVSVAHYRRWQALCKHSVLWANAYGPTETTVSATVFVPADDWQGTAMPIGQPLPGYTAFVLDKQMKVVAEGDTGELYIGGPALAEGYLNKLEQTNNAFVPDPFNSVPGARLYRTGDLARVLPSGDIDYAGRLDHQLKVGSYRIEPGEIENAIHQMDGVDDCVVMATQLASQHQLLAYVATSLTQISPIQIADHLRLQLPAYMMPSHYVLLERLPKTINGKIDRDALPDASNAVTARTGDFKAARTAVEKQLCIVFCDVLGLASISVDDSFLSLGGDSLMAVRAIASIQQTLHKSVSTRDFFLLDTVSLLAGHIEGYSVKKPVPPAQTFFLNSRSRQLYCVLQQPFIEQSNGIGILLVPPLGNEQRRCQRPMRSLMYNLSRQGYSLLRFDWRGTGNSSGDSKELDSAQHWKNDVLDAADELNQRCDEVHVVSVRFGSLISLLTDWDKISIGNHYLWDPVLDGAQWLEQMTQLHEGILNDSYRFLFKRKSRSDDLREMAGLVMCEDLYKDISSLTASIASDADSPHRQIVLDAMDEHNEWGNPRSTTTDMNINKTAGLLADLLQSELRSRG